ncbi:Bug family tripartite tricarboxylate transporter substrate binding protein, partial [Pseudomonas sp. BJa3]
GTIGAEAVASAAPDGYTLLYSTMGVLTINPSLYPKLRYDPQRSFAPVSMTNLTSNLLVVNPDLKVSSVAELAELARQRPGELTFSSSGN